MCWGLQYLSLVSLWLMLVSVVGKVIPMSRSDPERCLRNKSYTKRLQKIDVPIPVSPSVTSAPPSCTLYCRKAIAAGTNNQSNDIWGRMATRNLWPTRHTTIVKNCLVKESY